MIYRYILSLQLLLLLLLLVVVLTECKAEEETIQVLVGFRSRIEEQQFAQQVITASAASASASAAFATRASSVSSQPERSPIHEYQQTNAIAMEVTLEEYEEMLVDDRFLYVEKDVLTYKLSNRSHRKLQTGGEVEELSYGLISVQGDEDGIPLPPSSAPACLIHMCIVDSGIIESHYDIPYKRNSPYMEGQEFGLPDGQFWWNALLQDDHGTAVAGVMIAQGGNGRGTVGIIPDGPQDSKVCLSIARVFADLTDSTATSNILNAVEWCGNRASSGSRTVVNLSLGASAQTTTEQAVYESLYDQGVLFVAAGGNGGSKSYAYPASLDQVISVASVDEQEEHSAFSQVNDRIEVAAPGGQILTSSGGGIFGQRLDWTVGTNRKVQSFFMENNVFPDSFDFDQSFQVVDCEFGFEVCQGATGKVCLMQRDGVVTFREKALNCQSGGGIMALVYNNQGGSFNGRINDDSVTIPCLSMNVENGELVKENIGETLTTNNVYGNIGYFTGTSFSTPHVAGVAAKIWAARPECTNEQIRLALRNTARPVESAVPNDRTGYGIVQAVDAYNYILANFDAPCGGFTSAAIPTPDPSPSPTPDPSPSPTPDPTSNPTPDPTPSPTPDPTPSPTPDPTPAASSSACGEDLETCITTDDCCPDHECRRISADPQVPFVCRRVLGNTDKGDFKLARIGSFCRGGSNLSSSEGGCNEGTRRGKRLLRGEQAVAPPELAEIEEATVIIDDATNRDQLQEDSDQLPEA